MAAFDYELPPSAIAQRPVEPRHSARLLVATDPGGEVAHATVADLPELLDPGDVLVVNDSRVLPARLRLRKETGGEVEVLLLEPAVDGGSGWWEALVRPGRRVPPGTVLVGRAEHGGEDGKPAVEVGAAPATEDDGRRLVKLLDQGLPERVGAVALPPYVREPLQDPERYQTVYASQPGSVAAPTAGLHLTHEVLQRCRDRGIASAPIDLAVGLATFKPVTAARVQDHRMHAERYRVPQATAEAVDGARRVVAVGTTTVRALEAMAATGLRQDRTELFIHGSYPFRVVDVLLTNFHLPRSSLLLLLDAFCGPRWRDLYRVALESGYRFLSFGDAMLVARR